MLKLDDIIESILSYNHKANVDIVWKAYLYSAKMHRGQTRKSGDPYLSHPLDVAYILTKLKMDVSTIAAGILHDTLEDTYSTPEELRNLFGEEIVSLVDGVTKISKIHFKSREEKQAENFRKMIIAMANDIRIILIKLADRLHNMRTLQYVSRENQIAVATETKEIYAPIANRLGIHWLKIELEDYILRYLTPKDFEHINMKIKKSYTERKSYVKRLKNKIEEELQNANIEAIITGRPKHLYSIDFKMKSQNLTFDQIYDLLGLRIITSSVKDCYAIFGIIHSRWKPIRGKVKDYIAMPKANMYQSLHTTVVTNEGRRVEFQIRTEEMHEIAEEGIAAHWQYKSGKTKIKDDDKWFLWLRHLMEWQQDLKNPKEFLDMVKTDLFPDEVYVFSPKGDVKSFPSGATVVDFAYSIHTEIGNRCVGAKVNEKMVPLKYELKNGNILEILTSPTHVPNKDWLKFVKTSKAKNKIRNWIREEQKDRTIVLGREMLERALTKYDYTFPLLHNAKKTNKISKDLGFSTFDTVLANIGYGNLSIQHVIHKIIPKKILDEVKKGETAKKGKVIPLDSEQTEKEKTGIKVRGVDDILIRFGKCCNPISGDEIVGFITKGRGISVHVKDCSSVVELTAYDAERLINVEWDTDENIVQPVNISITTLDIPGLLAKISLVLTDCKVNICSANIQTKDKKAYFDLTVELSSLKQLTQVINALKKIKEVISVQRGQNLPNSQLKRMKRTISPNRS